jgi:hypothetical protein
LNAFTSPELIAYIERRLKECKAIGKVIPPKDKLQKLARGFFCSAVENVVKDELEEILSFEGICRHVAEGLLEKVSWDGATQWIKKGFAKNTTRSWDDILMQRVRQLIEGKNERLRELLLVMLREVIASNSDLR